MVGLLVRLVRLLALRLGIRLLHLGVVELVWGLSLGLGLCHGLLESRRLLESWRLLEGWRGLWLRCTNCELWLLGLLLRLMLLLVVVVRHGGSGNAVPCECCVSLASRGTIEGDMRRTWVTSGKVIAPPR